MLNSDVSVHRSNSRSLLSVFLGATCDRGDRDLSRGILRSILDPAGNMLAVFFKGNLGSKGTAGAKK